MIQARERCFVVLKALLSVSGITVKVMGSGISSPYGSPGTNNI